jgi:hypothetical protein
MLFIPPVKDLNAEVAKGAENAKKIRKALFFNTESTEDTERIKFHTGNKIG